MQRAFLFSMLGLLKNLFWLSAALRRATIPSMGVAFEKPMAVRSLALAVLLAVPIVAMSQEGTPATNICLGRSESLGDLGCTEDRTRPLNERWLLTLSCEPLSVIRNAIFVKYGLCMRDDFNQQFFDQSCEPNAKNADAALDKIEVWSGILLVAKVERLKGCIRDQPARDR